MRSPALFFLLLITGCGSPRLEIPESLSRRLTEPAPMPAIPAGTGEVSELQQEVKSSTNLTQNSITGLGANLGKLSETVQGFGGDLAHVSTVLRGSIEAQAQVAADLKAQIQASVQATVAARAELQALAGAQAGLKNEMEQLSQTARAGRDAVQTTTQFSREMASTIQSQQWGTVAIVVALAAVIVWDKERSRRRAEQRAAEHLAAWREQPHGKIGLGNGHGKGTA